MHSKTLRSLCSLLECLCVVTDCFVTAAYSILSCHNGNLKKLPVYLHTSTNCVCVCVSVSDPLVACGAHLRQWLRGQMHLETKSMMRKKDRGEERGGQKPEKGPQKCTFKRCLVPKPKSISLSLSLRVKELLNNRGRKKNRSRFNEGVYFLLADNYLNMFTPGSLRLLFSVWVSAKGRWPETGECLEHIPQSDWRVTHTHPHTQTRTWECVDVNHVQSEVRLCLKHSP